MIRRPQAGQFALGAYVRPDLLAVWAEFGECPPDQLGGSIGADRGFGRAILKTSWADAGAAVTHPSFKRSLELRQVASQRIDQVLEPLPSTAAYLEPLIRIDYCRPTTGSTCTSQTTTATYIYDGTGMRTSKTVGATTTSSFWDPSGKLPMLLREVAGSTTNYYIYGPGATPLEQISSSTFLYYHQDQLGSTRAMTDASGAVKATYSYDAFGAVSACTGTNVSVGGSNICTGTISVSNPLCYAGQYGDAESGLIYLRARFYDPSTGQFMSRDPAVATTRQPYAYTGDNPLNLTDPAGLWYFDLNVTVATPFGFGFTAGIQLGNLGV